MPNHPPFHNRTVLLVVAPFMLLAPAAGSQVPTVSRDVTIGCGDCGGALQFASLQTLEISRNGEILAVDRDNPMVRLFDATGKPMWSGGQNGRGPGEYQYVLRGAFRPDGGLDLLDFSGMRLTTLGPDRKVASTHPLTVFATTAGVNDHGAMVLAAEAASGALRVFRVRQGDFVPLPLPDLGAPAKNSSVAIAPNGSIAVIPHNDRYQIIRLDSVGKRLPDIARDIERVRRTPAEEDAMRAKLRGTMGQMKEAMEKSTGKTSSAPVQIESSQLSLKPHFAVDGLRYDSHGRLWVRTMRGDQTHTIFDVFSPTGGFLGSVKLDGEVRLFALAGNWLVTSGENADGVPVVTRWTLSQR